MTYPSRTAAHGVRRIPRADARRVVVVGAGLAGLSAALHLLGDGRSVTVLEAAREVGGRVGTRRVDLSTEPGAAPGDGYEIDTGASVLTMPDLIVDALDAVGADPEALDPPLRFHRMSPAYHARFADGTALSVHTDEEAMAGEVGRVFGPREARNYRRLRGWLASVFDAEFDRFMATSFDSPLDLVRTREARADVARLVLRGGAGRLGRRVAARIDDPRLRRVFTFQALYAGVPPQRALAAYAAIPHMDTSLGVYRVDGGMRTIARAMTDAVCRAGGTVLTGSPVVALERDGRRVRAVRTRSGTSHECDAVVLTPDLPVVDGLLGRRVRRGVVASPSAVVVHGTVPVAVARRWPGGHHTIDFGAAWDETFREITARRGRLMHDPSLLVTRPAADDPALLVRRGGDDHEPVSVLAPCPNLASAPLAWDATGDAYAAEILGVAAARGFTGIDTDLVVDHIDTPHTWAAQGHLHGSPFSAAHVVRQTGPFRRRNLDPRDPNVVLAGSGTVPGVGVPTVVLSGRLAAERLGVDTGRFVPATAGARSSDDTRS